MGTFIIVLLLLFLSGLFSGLNLGFMSLGKEELERKIKGGDTQAKVVYKLRKNGNLLLCTILIGNVFVNNTLAVFMGDMFTGTFAIIVATALIVVFGEILPQALCSRYPLQIGAAVAPVFKIFMYVLYPLCWPLAWVMDKALGPEPPTRHTKFEIGEMMNDHKEDDESEIDAREAMTVIGALTFSDLTAREVMTPLKNVYSFDYETVLTDDLITDIKEKGHTRIPMFGDPQMGTHRKIVGIVMVKRLLGVPVGSKVRTVCRDSINVLDSTTLDDVLEMFKKNRLHILIVQDEFDNAIGIITLEDVIEEVFQFEIMDETDQHENMREIDEKPEA